jgi:vanillate O-demethylase monooxygenase subunit
MSNVTIIPGAAPAPRSHWYAAAYSHEVGQKPLSRMILGSDLVFFRDGEGVARALDDRCAHRAAALSCGRVVDGALECFYHGLRYDGSGKCVKVPSQSAIPPLLRVKSYPAIEKCGYLWVWMGDQAHADSSLVPDFSEYGFGDSSFHYEHFFVMGIEGNYLLLHENLLDLSHLSYLHQGILDSGVMATAKPVIKVNGDTIVIHREVEETFVGVHAANFEVPDKTRLRRRLTSLSSAPALNVVHNHLNNLDDPSAPLRINHAIFPITPRDDRSCHYFVTFAKNYGGPYTEQFKKAVWDIFLADKTAIESIQRSYDKLGAATPDVSVLADNGGLHFRRILEKVIARDRAGAAVNAA